MNEFYSSRRIKRILREPGQLYPLLNEVFVEVPNYLQQLGEEIKGLVEHSFLGSYYDEAYNWVTSTLSDLSNIIQNYMGSVFEGVRSVTITLTNIVIPR